MADLKYQSDSPVLEEGVSAVTATNSVQLGTRTTYNGEDYVYCYNAGGATASQKALVKVITTASGYSVAATALTDTFAPAVGVVKHADIAAGSYGWILTRGFASVVVVSQTTADYLPIACGASGQVVNWAATGATQGIKVGVALNPNTGAAGTVYAYVNTGF